MRIRLSRLARADRQAATRFYARRSPVAAVRFRDELAQALKYIIQYPEGAPFLTAPVRAKTLHVFPYSVLYIYDGSEIRVLAIAHHAQDPEIFRERT